MDNAAAYLQFNGGYLLMLDAGLDQTRQLPLEVGNSFEVRADELNCFRSVGDATLPDVDLTDLLHAPLLLGSLGSRILAPRLHSLDDQIIDILLIFQEEGKVVVVFTPEGMLLFRERGILVELGCNEIQLVVLGARRWVSREILEQIERLLRIAIGVGRFLFLGRGRFREYFRVGTIT